MSGIAAPTTVVLPADTEVSKDDWLELDLILQRIPPTPRRGEPITISELHEAVRWLRGRRTTDRTTL